MGNLRIHAERELDLAGWTADGGGISALMRDGVLRLIDVFASEGHSGMSAPAAIDLFEKLARFEPLTPLTGADDEWMEVDDGLYQNVRYSSVFKDKDGAYDINGRVFREPTGVCFTSRDSRVPVTFPYTPTREYVDVPASE